MRFTKGRDVEDQLDHILNKGINLEDNFRGGLVEFTTAGGVDTIHHNLGYVPIGWIIIYQSAACTFYAEAPLTWTKEVMYLRSSVASVTVRIFVL